MVPARGELAAGSLGERLLGAGPGALLALELVPLPLMGAEVVAEGRPTVAMGDMAAVAVVAVSARVAGALVYLGERGDLGAAQPVTLATAAW